MGFWDRKLGNAQPAQPAQPPAQPQQQQAPWWQLTTTPAQQQPQGQYQQPVQQQTPTPVTDKTVMNDSDPNMPVFQRVQSVSAKAQNVANKQERHGQCPECSGTNYAQVAGAGKARCFDCGYPVMQQFSGLAGSSVMSDGSPAQMARQINNGAGNFNPKNVIGRVG